MIVSRNSSDRSPTVTIDDDPALLRDALKYEGEHGDDYNFRYKSRQVQSVLTSTFGIRDNGEVRMRDARVHIDMPLGRIETALVRYALDEANAHDMPRVEELLLTIDGIKQQLPQR